MVAGEFQTLIKNLEIFLDEISKETSVEILASEVSRNLLIKFETIKKINLLIKTESPKEKHIDFSAYYVLNNPIYYLENLKIILAWIILNQMESHIADKNGAKKLVSKILNKSFANIIHHTGNGDNGATRIISLLELLLEGFELFTKEKKESSVDLEKKKDIIAILLTDKKEFIKKMFEDDYVHKYLDVNIYKDIRYFNKERFEEFVKWLLNIIMINRLAEEKSGRKVMNLYCKMYEYLIKSSEKSGFQLDELEEILIHKNIIDK